MKITDHIPDVLKANPNVKNFGLVLDDLEAFKSETVFRSLYKSYFPFMQDNPDFLRKFLWEVGQIENMEGMPRVLLENLIMRANTIFAHKGTVYGFKLFMACLTGGDCSIQYGRYCGDFVFLRPGRIDGLGFLPNGNSLSVASNTPGNYPFLFGGKDLPEYLVNVRIKLISPYFYIKEFRELVLGLLPNYLPMISLDYANVQVEMYGHSFTSPIINSTLYNY